MSMMRQAAERSYFSPRKIKSFANFDVKNYGKNLDKLSQDLSLLGIGLDSAKLDAMYQHHVVRLRESAARFHEGLGQDAIQPSVTTASIPVPVQFLQNWLPGFVNVITAARKIDDLVGISTMGSWEDEEIVQGLLELVGTSQPYGDYTNVPFGSWNVNWNTRTVVRFEEGLRVGPLEEQRAARIRVDTGAQKRASAALALEIIRNFVGFYGFNNGANLTYGFLNDPGLPSYISAPNGASGSPLWANKTFLEIQKDILGMISRLRNGSLDQIDPEKVDITLGLATVVVDFLSKTSDFGISVREWMREAYPRIRVVSAPELDQANGGANVAYMYAERIDDLSTDDGRTFIQVVPAKFQVVGVSRLVKDYQEDYTNATAGVMCKRPWAVQRLTGI